MLKYLRLICKVLPSVIFAYFAWIFRYSRNPKKYPYEVRFKKVQKLIRKVIKGFNIVTYDESFKKFYKTRDKDKNYVFYSNHLSFLDPLVIIANADRPITFVAKKESEKMLFVGRIIKILDGEFLDREDNKKALRTFLNVQNKLLSDQKMDVLIFPEGTRNKDPLNTDLAYFHPGSFRCALKTKSNIAVISLFGTFRGTGIKYKAKYNPVNINVIEELKYEDYKDLNTEQISEYIYDKINSDVKVVKEINYKELKMLNTKNIY